MTKRLTITALSIIGTSLACIALSAVPASTTQTLQLAIHDIQGNGATSPQVGKTVSTDGIVTAVKSNGFFLQAPVSQADRPVRSRKN